MDRRHFLAGAVSLSAAAKATVVAAFEEKKTREVCTFPASSLAVEPLMDRYRLTLNRVLHGTGPAYTPEFLLEDIYARPGRRFTDFSGDVSGRWIGALSTASAAYGQNFPALHEVVRRTIALQSSDGYFGKEFHLSRPNDEDLALLWGNGRLLIGLLEYYAWQKDPAVLTAAKKLGDFLLRIAPSFNSKEMADEFGAAYFASSYICWTQQTEGLAALYVATKDARYRDLCAAISERIVRRPADHVHGYLCSLRGTVDLYNATGDRTHLQRVETAWMDITNSGDVLITGGLPEAWSPKKKRTEGCAECDWLRLNLSLWKATGNAKYLNMAERVLFNEFAMNQFDTGDFGHAVLNELGTPDTVYVRAWWCCTLHGLRAFPDISRSVFQVAANEVSYNLPIDGHIETPDVSVRATSRLAIDGTVHLHIVRASAEHTLTFRKPSWADELTLLVNGEPINGLTVNKLNTGTVITGKYAMTRTSQRAGDDNDLAKRTAIYYGPWLLGVSSEVNPHYFNELHPGNTLLLHSAKSSCEKPGSSFDVPIAATTAAYIPAEFPEQPSHVELRAVAEQTAIRPTHWEMSFVCN